MRDAAPPYRVTDQLFLWLLIAPSRPVLIGDLEEQIDRPFLKDQRRAITALR